MPFTADDVQNELKHIQNKLSESIQAVNEEVKKHGEIGTKNKEALNTLEEKIKEATARVLELEQAGTSQSDVDNAIKSVGAEFTDSQAYTDFSAGNTTKATFAAENNAVTNDEAATYTDRRSGVLGLAMRKLRVLDVLPKGSTSSNSIEYTREVLWDNKAAETAEGPGAAYPESSIQFETTTVPVRNIGHFIYVSKQMLEDNQAIASYIDGRLRYGVEYRKDLQALRGNGTGQNLKGIFSSGSFTNATNAGQNIYETVRRAMAQVELADYSATAIILNPSDCADMDLLTGNDEHFISTNPRAQNVKTLWGLPVVETNAMPAGRFLTGAFDMASQWTERRGVVVEMSDADGDNFTKDMVTIKATARAALEIYRPISLVGGDITAAPSTP
ncbi:phage major capsid protein [Marinibactrum halimedae]|uniref:Phage capsid-like C-terminal domain-containing protein n=1 Tax=Marinibactrum halimedae TaxID=1444977 RepID=A0AA37WQ66_9GAMM|nr:phage major capsid protein [Marinibactrum halimedae]MCD9458892.1 phage major capsid protein [Marinibactrum halimedae]GLS27741.1 hypothetical protein GCM10007877_34600 [Marinibactrum halimedae]